MGDRYVLAELNQRGWALGGEQSGHVIETGFVPAGDGIAAALLTLEALGDADLAERNAMVKLPQRLINVPFATATPSRTPTRSGRRWRGVRRLEGEWSGARRASGTEPLLRVMVEAPGQDQVHEIAQRLADLAQAELG